MTAIFLVLTALTLVMLVQSGIALFRARFPHPTDLATVSIVYYGVPLSVAGYFDLNYRQLVFLANFAADRTLAFQSMIYITAALIFLRVGHRLGSAMGSPSLKRLCTLDLFARERARLAFCGLIGLTLLGIYLFGLRAFLAGYATEGVQGTGLTGNALIYATLELMGLTMAFALVLGLVMGRTPLKLLIFATILIAAAVLAVRAKRLEIVSALIPPVVVLLSTRGSLSSTQMRVVGGTLLVALLVFISAARSSDQLGVFQSAFYFFAEGIYAGHSLPGITERLGLLSLDYEGGARFLTAFLGFMPRFLWEGKDDMVYAGNLALEGVAPLGATSLLAEVVLQGGVVAVMIVYLVMGWIFERAARFEDGWDAAIANGMMPARFGLYLILVANFIPHFRDGIIPSIKLSLQAGVFFILLAGVPLFRSAFGLVPGDAEPADGAAGGRAPGVQPG